VHPAQLTDADLLAQCEVFRTRGTGPGGRHRNSTDSRIVLRHRATGVEATAGERRSQHANLDEAVRRLRCALAVRVRATPGLPSPSALWVSRVRARRMVCSPDHADFPALLAETLDAVAAREGDARAAAEHLGVTTTQLVRFVALHPPAMEALNRERASRGLSPLRG
jgi:hypothetical protein